MQRGDLRLVCETGRPRSNQESIINQVIIKFPSRNSKQKESQFQVSFGKSTREGKYSIRNSELSGIVGNRDTVTYCDTPPKTPLQTD